MTDENSLKLDSNSKRRFNPVVLTLLVLGIALIGYQIYRDRVQRETNAQHEARMEQQAAALKQQAERLSQQAAALSEQTDAMKQQVQDEHLAAEQEKQRYISAANIAEGMQASSFAKVAITDFYQSENRWPGSNKDIGMQAPEKFAGRSLRSMEVSEGGVITLTYDDKTGVDKGTIRLIPDGSNAGYGIKWRCVTASYVSIATIMPTCEYVPEPTK